MIDPGGSSLAAAAAFLQRGIRRTIGLEPDVKTRARRCLHGLKKNSKFAREIARINSIRDWEVLNEESALIPDCLELQLHLLELAKYDPGCARWAEMELGQVPIGKLFKAIVAQGVSDGYEAGKLSLGNPVLCDFRRGSHWENVMRIPRNLGTPLLGFATRLEATGLEPMKQFAGWDFIKSLGVEISDPHSKVVTLIWS